VTNPRRGHRQRAARTPSRGLGALQAQVKLALPGRQALTRDSLQHLDVEIIMRRSDVLDILWVPRTSSTSCDQPVFVDHATDASVPSDTVLLKIDPFG